jgi:ABC-type sugar transport system substrate-binding protein
MARAAAAAFRDRPEAVVGRNNEEGANLIKNRISCASIASIALAYSASGAFAADKPLYAVLVKSLSNQFFIAAAQGVDEGARKADVDIILAEGQTGQWAESQVSACETMLERKPAAMIAAAINSTLLLPCLKHYNEMKIPIVDLDNNLDSGLTKKAGVEIAFHIGSNNEAAGAMGADYLVSALGKDAKGPVLVIEGLSGNVTGAKRAHGFAEELKKQAPGLTIVASLPGDWDSLKAANIANDTLERNPDLVAIFCANDDMALGAVEAARAAGKDKVVVIGVDGTQSALKSIRAGRLDASVAQLPYLMGMRAVEESKKALAGEKVPEFVDVPTLVLTKEIIEANREPLLQYVK